MKANLKIKMPKVKGIITATVRKPSGQVLERKKLNVITQLGYSYLYGANAPSRAETAFNYLAVGSGTALITDTSTDLTTEIGTHSTPASKALSLENIEGTNFHVYTLTRVYSPGTVTGSVGEVGIYRTSQSGTLMAGQRFEDEFGDPAPIDVDPEDELTINYSLLFPVLTLPMETEASSVVINSVTHNYTVELLAGAIYANLANNYYMVNLPFVNSANSARNQIRYDGTLSSAATQDTTIVEDLANKTATRTISIKIQPSEGAISFSELLFGYAYDGYFGAGENQVLRLLLDTPIAKAADERFTLDLDLTVDWS